MAAATEAEDMVAEATVEVMVVVATAEMAAVAAKVAERAAKDEQTVKEVTVEVMARRALALSLHAARFAPTEACFLLRPLQNVEHCHVILVEMRTRAIVKSVK